MKKKEEKTCRIIQKNYEYIDDETKYIQIDINTRSKEIYNSLLREEERKNETKSNTVVEKKKRLKIIRRENEKECLQIDND